MRIIAGKYKRTPLKTLDSLDTRPTKDMVKEALFSSVSITEGDSFLDLFAGSGAIGIEAISRGASKVVFNDANKEACRIIKENLDKINEKARIYDLDYEECLFKVNEFPFDYIYLDPPYAFKEYDKLFELIGRYHVLAKKGIIITEVRKDVDLKDHYLDMYLYKERRYGISKLLYYRRRTTDE
ncbi:MAG: 16S rRNA (guanine(966)-N(2))-methyltransferase RsmD [Erysipelotrichaceae bacterium]|nr:16S rRNA (guanine(966)-N(2))-methyltransferase RsmD [Erysipelotrichaceae bacterium]